MISPYGFPGLDFLAMARGPLGLDSPGFVWPWLNRAKSRIMGALTPRRTSGSASILTFQIFW